MGGHLTHEQLRASLIERMAPLGAECEVPGPEDPRLFDYGPLRPPTQILSLVTVSRTEQVQELLRWAYETGTPLTARGRGTGLSGGANAIAGGVILDLSQMNRILDLNPMDQTALVEPGVINADLDAAAGEHGLMYAPDPASFRLSTIGGNVSTNAGGLRCAKYGVTRDSVLALDVVMSDGTLIRTGSQTFKGVVGYDLASLIVGSEGTLGIVVGIRVRLRPRPLDSCQAAFAFDDVAGAAVGVVAIGQARVQPAVVEFLDRGTLESLDESTGSQLAALGGAVLLVETDGFGAQAEMEALTPPVEDAGGRLCLTGEEAAALLDLRRQARGDLVDHDLRVGEDIAVPRSRLVEIVEEMEAMARDHAVNLKIVAHAADGNLHPTFWLPEMDDAQERAAGVERLNRALDDSVRAALRLGGTISGEHGIGLYKAQWMSWEQAPEVIDLQRRLKEVFDPRGILNPGKALPLVGGRAGERAAPASAEASRRVSYRTGCQRDGHAPQRGGRG